MQLHETRLIACSTDLCGSVDAESNPFFDDVGISVVIPRIRCVYKSEGFHKIDKLVHFSNEFTQILRRVEDSTDMLRLLRGENGPTFPLDLRDEFTSIQYALLRMESSAYDWNMPRLQRICLQGLLLYLATILNGLPSIASNFDMLGANLVIALQDLFGENEETQGLRLWLAVIIATIVYDKTSQLWAQREFATIILRSFSRRQEYVKAQLETFLWVDRIHGPSLDILWNKALGSRQS